MNKHITFWQVFYLLENSIRRRKKDSNNGYIPDCDTPAPTPAEVSALEQLPSWADLDRACAVTWKEAAALAIHYCGMEVPELPLKSTVLHPLF
jgi:hypothetical protein